MLGHHVAYGFLEVSGFVEFGHVLDNCRGDLDVLGLFVDLAHDPRVVVGLFSCIPILRLEYLYC